MPPRPASFSGHASRSFSFRWKRRRAAIVDGIGELCCSRHQFLPRQTELPRILGDPAHQDVEDLWVDTAYCESVNLFVDATSNVVCDTDVGLGSRASVWRCPSHFRLTPQNPTFAVGISRSENPNKRLMHCNKRYPST